MSSYPTWSFRVPLRGDLEPETLRVLDAVARDVTPDADDLATLHPVVARYLGDWRRMLTGERPPYVGPPVRLSGIGTHEPSLTIEFSQHDDEHANGGWVMWVWVLRIAARPLSGRRLIGHHGLSERHDDDWRPIVVDATGVREGDLKVPWPDIDATWENLADDPHWRDWRP